MADTHPTPATLDDLRLEVDRWPAERALYRLCLEVPPADPGQRPPNLRWIIAGGGGVYLEIARAWADGQAGAPLTFERARWYWRAAYLAGLDAATGVAPAALARSVITKPLTARPHT